MPICRCIDNAPVSRNAKNSAAGMTQSGLRVASRAIAMALNPKPSEKPSIMGPAAILQALSSVPTAVDELVRRCQVSAATVAEVLLSLELEGRLERHRGNRVSLI